MHPSTFISLAACCVEIYHTTAVLDVRQEVERSEEVITNRCMGSAVGLPLAFWEYTKRFTHIPKFHSGTVSTISCTTTK
jgi:hypothetical protein